MPLFPIWWAWLDLNQRPIGYAYHYSFRYLLRVCSLDCLFTRMGYLPYSLYTFPVGLGSGLPSQASPNLTGYTYQLLDKQPVDILA